MSKDQRRGAGRPRPKGGNPRPRQDRGPGESDRIVLYGFHPVVEALANPRRTVLRLMATENAAIRLRAEHAELEVHPDLVRPEEISRLLEPDAVHQGLYLEAEPLPELTLDDLGPEALVIALDQITDPHNVGAITRTAAAFGVDAIVTTIRHSPSATGVLAKAASGGLEHVPVISVRNLAEALISLGERGFRRIGLDSAGETSIRDIPAARPTILVLGAEGPGLRQRTRGCCDLLARLDMPGAIKSLNVSNAAAIALYALSERPDG